MPCALSLTVFVSIAHGGSRTRSSQFTLCTTWEMPMNAPATNIKFRFNPSQGKAEKILGPLEAAIMDVVWDQGTTTVSRVHRALRDSRDVAYTTIMTTMSRLAKKRL